MTTRSVGAAPDGVLARVRRRPVATFLALLFGVGLPVMALPILAHHGIIPGASLPARVGLDTERVVVLLMMYGVMLPAAVAVTWATDGRDGLRRLLRRAVSWRFGLGWWAAVLFALPVGTIAVAVLMGDSLGPLTPSLLFDEMVGLGVGFLVVNLGEETAWAGLVQTRLEERRGIAIAALLTAVPFALIHVPLQFIGPFSLASVLVGTGALLVLAGVFRLLIGFFLRGTGGSLLAAGLLHAVFNRSNNADGLVAGLLEGDAQPIAVLVATVAVTVGAGLAVRGRRPRREGGATARAPLL